MRSLDCSLKNSRGGRMDAYDLSFQLISIAATRFDDITDELNVMQHLTLYGLVHFWLVMQCVVKN